MHQGGRARACRSIGKKDVHVARAHFAAVDAVGRAGIALDAARNVERIMLVEFGRGLARSVVDVDCDLRMIAVRASPAGEAGLDQEIGRLDERFEADEAQAREFHAAAVSWVAAGWW